METEISRPAFTFIDKSIVVDNNTLLVDNKTLSLLVVTSIKYGWAPIRIDMYTTGGRDTIELKTPQNKLQVSFRSYFGISKQQQSEKFHKLLEAVWDATVVRLHDEMVDKVSNDGA